MNPRLPTALLLAARGLRQHAAASCCAIALLALATGGALAALSLREASARAFAAGTGPFDAVLGARGSPLQIVLSSLYHLEAAPGLVPEAELAKLSAHPAVSHALPLVLGDNHQGWRLVGTSPALFDPGLWHDQAATPRLLPGGRLFDPARQEIVAGSQAASALGLRPGAHLTPTHGLDYAAETAEDHAHEEEFTVVGVLAPTGTPVDRVLWAPTHALQHLGGHDPAHAHDLSAVLVRFHPEAGAAGLMLAQSYNAPGGSLTLAWPVAAHVAALFERFAWADRLLELAAAFAALLSALCVVITLQASLAQRRRDWAILRAIGARAGTLGSAILAEALLLGLAGALGALAIATALQSLVAWQLRLRTGVLLAPLPPPELLAGGAGALLFTCALAACWPAWIALRSPVAEHLAPPA
jgi:putative ABC transport system permease protein